MSREALQAEMLRFEAGVQVEVEKWKAAKLHGTPLIEHPQEGPSLPSGATITPKRG